MDELQRTDVKEESFIDQSLSIIKHNGLLKEEEFKAIADLKEDLNHNFQVGQLFRSRVEMEVSVLNDMRHPTPDAKYWQSIREQNVHFSELVGLSYEYRKCVQKIKILQSEIDELEHQIKTTKDMPTFSLSKIEAKIEIKRIDIERHKWGLINMTKTARNRIREVTHWADIIAKLKPNMNYSQDTYEEHQWEALRLRFQRQLDAVKAGKAKMSPGEASNLMGLMNTMERVIQGRGVMLGEDKKQELKGGGENGSTS
jgi:hypothetical protein